MRLYVSAWINVFCVLSVYNYLWEILCVHDLRSKIQYSSTWKQRKWFIFPVLTCDSGFGLNLFKIKVIIKLDRVLFAIRIWNHQVFFMCVFVCMCQIQYQSTQHSCQLICCFTVIDLDWLVSNVQRHWSCKFDWRPSISSPAVFALLSRCGCLHWTINITLAHWILIGCPMVYRASPQLCKY